MGESIINTYILDKNKLKENKIFYLNVKYNVELTNEDIKSDYPNGLVYISNMPITFEWYYNERKNKIIEKTDYIKYTLGEYQLKDGEYINPGEEEIKKINKPDYIKPYKWIASSKEWIIDEEEVKRRKELQTKEAIRDYFPIIDNLKAEILSEGFDYKGHKQKCREKDLIFMANAILGLQGYKKLYGKELKTIWMFNDVDGIEANERDLIELHLAGTVFVEKVYMAEKIFKVTEPFLITKVDFIAKVNEQGLIENATKQIQNIQMQSLVNKKKKDMM